PRQAVMKDHGIGYRTVHAARADYVLQEVSVADDTNAMAVSRR
ncbi:MAG: hypothetical protein JWN48_2741, partial [Myxococcaceae bacterium]|nr:hypothetical protein [Myxococcaceae bacterium]